MSNPVDEQVLGVCGACGGDLKFKDFGNWLECVCCGAEYSHKALLCEPAPEEESHEQPD